MTDSKHPDSTTTRPGALEVSTLDARTLWRYRPWVSGHTRSLFTHWRAPVRRDTPESDETHLLAAIKWLCQAQDASEDGGVVGRYRLDRGWTSSYPETTGYIIPTFVSLAQRLARKTHR